MESVRDSNVGYIYDQRLTLHSEEPRHTFPEFPERVRSIHNNFESKGLLSHCRALNITPADPDFVKTIHQASLIERLLDLKFEYDDTMNPVPRKKGVKYTMGRQLYDNEHTSDCIFLSCGGAIKAVDAVWKRQVNTCFANIRPPGHHASFSEIGGFCYVNNVAVAAKHALSLGARKVLIYDWDVHHGNGTQDIFQNDPDVMYISAHRYDNAAFYPYLKKAGSDFCGTGEGRGRSFNIAWNTEETGKLSGISDGDYKHAFDNLIMPIATQFNPDIVLVSAGFDAMKDDPVGNLSLSPAIYAYMTKQLQELANGKLALILEGGYNLDTMMTASEACMKALLGYEEPVRGVGLRHYDPETTELGREAVRATYDVAREYWDIQ